MSTSTRPDDVRIIRLLLEDDIVFRRGVSGGNLLAGRLDLDLLWTERQLEDRARAAQGSAA